MCLKGSESMADVGADRKLSEFLSAPIVSCLRDRSLNGSRLDRPLLPKRSVEAARPARIGHMTASISSDLNKPTPC